MRFEPACDPLTPLGVRYAPGDRVANAATGALRNLGGGRFVAAPEWGLGATESGRAMALGDLDRLKDAADAPSSADRCGGGIRRHAWVLSQTLEAGVSARSPTINPRPTARRPASIWPMCER